MNPPTITLNIGMSRNDGRPDNSEDFVLGVLTGLGLTVRRHRLDVFADRFIRQPALIDAKPATLPAMHGEDTLVVQVVMIPLAGEIVWRACNLLAQDCIAFKSGAFPNLQGHLIGPKSVEWGPFDPKKFITLEGKTLAQPSAA